MKGFASGVGGVCICVLAIMGTVLCGYALGGEEVQTTKTEWSQLADTTGLFDVSTAPAFTSYNPAANWTGYRASGSTSDEMISGVEYSLSNRVNGYPIGDSGTAGPNSWFSTDLIAATELYADPPGLYPHGYPSTYNFGSIWITDQRLPTSQMSVYVSNPRVITIEQLVSIVASMQKYDRIDLYLNNMDLVRAWAAPSSWWKEETWESSVGFSHYRTNWVLPLEESSKTVLLKIYRTQDIVIGQDADGIETFRATMGTTTFASRQAEAQGHDPVYTNEPMFLATTWKGIDIEPGQAFKWVGYTDGQLVYMDVSKGVIPTSQDSLLQDTYWSNGYQNGKIDMLIRWNSSASSTKTVLVTHFPVEYPDGSTTKEMDVYVNVFYQNGQISIQTFNLSLSSPVVRTYTAGNFAKGILLSLDMYEDRLQAYAIDTFQDFQEYSLLKDPIISKDTFFSEISGLRITFTPGDLMVKTLKLSVNSDTTTRPTIGIVSTSVYLGDSTLIMSEPEFRPAEYWPDLEAWELRFYSFAYQGWGMSVRNDTYIMSSWLVEDGKITIDGTAHDLSNFWIRAVHNIETDKWDLYVIFGDEAIKRPIYIFSASGNSPWINMYGNWYFQSSIYAGSQVSTTEYNFDFQHFIFDSNGAILAYLGILIIGAIVANRLGGLGIYDAIVLTFAGVCGFVLMVA